VATFNDLLSQLDPDDRLKGMQFERICKWFLSNDPLFAARLRHVWLWKEWPDRWSGTEAGIDLVAEDFDGHLWAVQAKAYREDRAIPKSELNKFLSESNRVEFSQRLLIATTDGLHHIAQGTLSAQEKSVSFVGLSDLRDADEYLEWPNSPDDLRPSPPPKPSKPHDYQREAIEEVVKGFKNSDRGQLIMACGTGKTLTSLFIKEKLAADRALVLVPSLSLLKQTMRVWSANRTDEFATLPVCSDATVSQNDDAAVMYTSELGVPVTTHPAEIASFLREQGPRVVFATYQSSPQIAAAFTLGRVPAFDLVVADEAHRCAGPVSSDFATILEPAAIKAQRRLFMTATPRYFTGRVIREAKEADFDYASMDDGEKFGTVFHRLGFSDAIRQGLLTEYQVAVIGVDHAMYKEQAERGTLVTLDGKTPRSARTLAGQIGLAKAMRKYQLRRTISFHSRVSSAMRFAASMHDVLDWMPARQRPTGRLWAEHASGEMSAGQRGRLIERLSQLEDGERGLLTNARCLAEGVDVPTLDGVAFIDPRRSEVDIVQAVGRAIRKADDKTVGTIVIPVFISTDEDPEVALDSSAFKPVWDVIKALRSHDEDLGEELDELRRQLGRHGGPPRLPGKIQLDLPEKVGDRFARAFDVRLVEQTTVSWEFWFGLLERFLDRNGHASPPASYEVDGFPLGEWVSTQRDRKVNATLRPDRAARLTRLSGWTWDPNEDKWEEGFRRLLDYIEAHGHVRMGQGTRVDGYPLGAWINTQRIFFGRGTLRPDRTSRLAALPVWAWDPRDDLWEKGFRQLLSYVKSNGDARVPRSRKIDGYDLGGWVKDQRGAFARGDLSEARAHRLDDLNGWSWDPITEQWEETFNRLLEYADSNGDAFVPASYKTDDGYALGRWVVHQRSLNTTGALEAIRKDRLETVVGWAWNARDVAWEEGFCHLLDFAERHGNALVPVSHKQNGYPLGQWVTTQRQFFSQGTLDADRQRRLADVPDWMWNGRDAVWEESFRRLVDYVKQNGDSLVQRRYKDPDGYALGMWVMRQRKSFAGSTLDPERERRLKLLPKWRWAR
jgi:superfamily II DNA or RNA helicase